jgi:hypothetical protein
MRPVLIIALLLVSLGLPAAAPAQEGCALAATAPPSAAQVNADGSVGLTRLSALGGAVTAAVHDGTAVAFGQGGLLRHEPPLSGAPDLPISDLARDMTATAAALYVAAGSAGLIVLPAGRPAVTLPLPGLPSAVTVVGPRAYVAAAGPGGGLHIVDVADPARPQLRASAAVAGSASGVAVAGDVAYVAGGLNGGVEIFAVTDPAAPVRLGGIVTPGAARAIVVVGDRAYVAAGICGLQTLDIADPAAPRLLSAVPTGGEALALAHTGTTLFVAAGAGGIARFALGGATPQLVAQTAVPGVARQLSLGAAELLIAAEDGGLFALALSTPGAAPRLVGAGDVPLALAHDGERAFLGLRRGGVAVVGRADPLAPRLAARLPLDGAVRALALDSSADRLYSAVDGVGIVTLAVNGLAAPTERSRTAAPGQVTALLLDPPADRLYAAVGSAGVAVYDVGDPDAPALLRTIDTPGAALGLAQSGDLLLVADRTGLQLITLPSGDLRGAYAAPAGSFVQDVAAVGGTALLADRSGLLVVDIANPATPQRIGDVRGFSAYRVLGAGDRAYVAAGPAGILAFDLADAPRPRLVGVFATPGSALDLAHTAAELAVADEAGGLLLLAVRDLPNRTMLPLIGR